jgi:DNA (cytosine-5)-methyltransferase 1
VIADAVSLLNPRAIVVENVPVFLTRQVRHPVTNVPISAANYLVEALGDGYSVYPMTSDLSDFGIPQSRRRSFLTFLRKDEVACAILERNGWAPYPWPSHAAGRRRPITVTEALMSYRLPSLDAKNVETATSPVPMHSVPVWPPERYLMVSSIPPNSGLSAWDNSECVNCGHISPDRASPQCLACGMLLPRPIVRSAQTEPRLVTGFHSSYRRMEPDLPASTVTTASGHLGSDRTIHPWENRVLSPLECALLQTLPRSFKWGSAMKKYGHTNVRIMIGEAVPPLFTKKHGRILASLLTGIPPRVALSESDRRVRTAADSLRRGRRISSARTEQSGDLTCLKVRCTPSLPPLR